MNREKRSLKIFILLILFSSVCFAQIPGSNSLIKKLDNSQFVIIHGERPTFKMSSKPALKLIKRGTSVSKKLVVALNDPGKTIMAHLILCHIYFKVATFAGPKSLMENNKEIFKYFLGQKDGEGLIISEIKEGGTYKMYVIEKDRQQIIDYWQNKIAKKQD